MGLAIPEFRKVLTFSACSAFAVILFQIFSWHLIHVWTPFLHYPIGIAVGVGFLAATLLSLIYLLFRVRKEGLRAFLPFLIQITAFAVLYFVPIDAVVLDLDFKINLNKRMEIVRRIEAGEFSVSERGLVQLPFGYGYLSRGGGEVIVERDGVSTKVFFFTYRGILDNFSGFAYTSEETLDRTAFNGDFKELNKLRDHWYWAASW